MRDRTSPLGSRGVSLEASPSLRVAQSDHLNVGYTSRFASSGLTILVLLVGLGYLSLQWERTGSIEDALFVSLLVGASAFLLLGLRSLRGYMISEIQAPSVEPSQPSDSGDRDERGHRDLTGAESVDWIFSPIPLSIAGATYGLLVGSAPFVVGAWPKDPVLATGLSAFLFSVNFLSGVAFLGLVRFFKLCYRMAYRIKINLWELESPETAFVFMSTRKVALLVAIYVSICLSSILFSVLPITGLVFLYVGFTSLIVLGSFLVPSHAIATRMKSKKTRALHEVNRRVEAEYERVLGQISDIETVPDMRRLEALLTLRERISRVRVWPFQMEGLRAGASLLALSVLPLVLQWVLQVLR